MNPGGSITGGSFHTNKTYTPSDRNGSQRRCKGTIGLLRHSVENLHILMTGVSGDHILVVL